MVDAFSLIFADVQIRHPRITSKEELKPYSNFQSKLNSDVGGNFLNSDKLTRM